MAQNPFDLLFAAVGKSPTLRGIYRKSLGPEYLEEAAPMGFVTRTELATISKQMGLGANDVFLDLGCGEGGPGQEVARSTGASLWGIDSSTVAIEHARLKAQGAGLRAQCEYLVADICDTGVETGMFRTAVCIDALQLVDCDAALAEVWRVLRPGGIFAFTSWEVDPAMMPGAPAGRVVRDYGPRLEAAGFTVELQEEPEAWLLYQMEVCQGVVAAQKALEAELGKDVCAMLVDEAKADPRWLPFGRRVLVTARKNHLRAV